MLNLAGPSVLETRCGGVRESRPHLAGVSLVRMESLGKGKERS